MGRYMDVPLTRGASVLCYAAIETPRRAAPCRWPLTRSEVFSRNFTSVSGHKANLCHQ